MNARHDATDTERLSIGRRRFARARAVLVTGASRGIGRSAAIAFGAQGARVAICHPGEPEAAAETADRVRDAGGTAYVVDADIGDATAVRRMVLTVHGLLGPLDVLVNSAGFCPFSDFFDFDVELWDEAHHRNLRGAFLITQAVTSKMLRARRPGRVIFVASTSAWTGGPLQSRHCSTSAGVRTLMRSLALVLGPRGITCNAVVSGLVASDIETEELDLAGPLEQLPSRIPVGGLGRPEDIARAIVLLASDEGAPINGAELVCAGGMLVNLQ